MNNPITNNQNPTSEAEFAVSDDVLVKHDDGRIDVLKQKPAEASTSKTPLEKWVASAPAVVSVPSPVVTAPVVNVATPVAEPVAVQTPVNTPVAIPQPVVSTPTPVVSPTITKPVTTGTVSTPSVSPQPVLSTNTQSSSMSSDLFQEDVNDQLILDTDVGESKKLGFFSRLFGGKKKEIVQATIAPQSLEGLASFAGEEVDGGVVEEVVIEEVPEEELTGGTEKKEVKRPEVLGEYGGLTYTGGRTVKKVVKKVAKKNHDESETILIGDKDKKKNESAFDISKYDKILQEAQEKASAKAGQFVDVEEKKFTPQQQVVVSSGSRWSGFFKNPFKRGYTPPKSIKQTAKKGEDFSRPVIAMVPVQPAMSKPAKSGFSFSSLFHRQPKTSVVPTAVSAQPTVGRPVITAPVQPAVGRPAVMAPAQPTVGSTMTPVQPVVKPVKSSFSFSSLFHRQPKIKTMPMAQIPVQPAVARPVITAVEAPKGFVYGAGDAKEVAQLATHPAVGGQLPINDKVDQLLKQITGKLKLDANLFNRLSGIVTAYLRDVRNVVDTKMLLQRSLSEGGLNLPAEQAEEIMKLILPAYSSLHPSVFTGISTKTANQAQLGVFSQTAKTKTGKGQSFWQSFFKHSPKPQTTPLKPSSSWWKKMLTIFTKKKTKLPEVKVVSEVKTAEPAVVTPPAPVTKTKIEPVVLPSTPVQLPPQKPSLPVQSPSQKPEFHLAEDVPVSIPAIPRVMRVKAGEVDKTRMADIKTVSPHLVGPVEEIAEMTLADFRRLGSTAEESVGKIREKIKLMENDSFSKKIACIEAWQRSQTNKIYLDLGSRSLLQKISVAELIKQDQAEKKPVLTLQEFDFINKLNKELLY